MKASTLVTRRRVVFGIAASSFLISDRAGLATGVAAIKALKPGEFIWRPEISPRGPVVIVVSLPEQLVHVYRNGATFGRRFRIQLLRQRPATRRKLPIPRWFRATGATAAHLKEPRRKPSSPIRS